MPSTVGWGEDIYGPNAPYSYGLGYTEVAGQTVTTLTLRTYVYEVWSLTSSAHGPGDASRAGASGGEEARGVYLGFYPTTPANASFANTVLGPVAANRSPCEGSGCDGVAARAESSAASLRVRGVVPNPVATVHVELAEASDVEVVLFDLLGREVLRVAEGHYEGGTHRVRLDASGLLAGVYVVSVTTGSATVSERVTVLR